MAINILSGKDPKFLWNCAIEAMREPSFCKCVFPRSSELLGLGGSIHERITCKCGEDEGRPLEWIWDKASTDPECYITGTNITFHPIFSQGTTIVRGAKPLDPGMIHYWEIKIMTSLSGTETMIGIGTHKVDLLAHCFHFTSALGKDDQSWGYSFRGNAQHNSRKKFYGKPYSQGCLVGVYVDMTRGRLEFYVNRRSLGIAYKNIPVDPSVKIYPMVCSTAANSSIRLINSTSSVNNLEFQSMRIVAKKPILLANIKRTPGLKFLLDRYWYLIPSNRCARGTSEILSLEDEAVIPTSKAKKCKIAEDLDDVTDLYADADAIKHRSTRASADSDEELSEEFDEPSDFSYYFCDH